LLIVKKLEEPKKVKLRDAHCVEAIINASIGLGIILKRALA